MSEPVAPKFLPWLRTGLAAQIEVQARNGLAAGESASVHVSVELHAEGTRETVEVVPSPVFRLRSPGEVVGFDPALIVRQDPAPGTSDAEGTYFALIEFSAPDFPWRYTPAAASANRLQPWIALVVVEEGERARLEDGGTNRLPVLVVSEPSGELPDLAECWAWAHVHADHDLGRGVESALKEAPHAFRSRLLCPRRLPPRRSWLACVVPTFASGRNAGLGAPVVAGMGLAWDAASREEVRLPVYCSWRFQTGPGGDFESLVRRLSARVLPADVGRRDLDISDPGGGLPRVDGMRITYEGALVSTVGGPRPWPKEPRAAMKESLAEAINAEPLRTRVPSAYDALRDDPVVAPPAYGAIQAGERRVPAAGEPLWLSELNTEPPHRTVAGVAAEVIRRDQEALMAAAWDHAASAVEATRILSRARTAWEGARRARPAFDTIPDERFLQLVAPAMARLQVRPGLTVKGAVRDSPLPPSLVSPAFKRFSSTVVARVARDGRTVGDAITKAALADPIAFVGAWADLYPPAGAETAGPQVGMEPGPIIVERAAPRAAAARSIIRIETMPDAYVLAEPVRGLPTIPYSGDASSAATVVADARAALNPLGTITAMVNARIGGLAPDRTQDVPDRVFVRPAFMDATYRRLVALSVEYMVPGVGDIPPDTLGLLETNPAFVEAYLAGLNTEMGREFLWREYPARLDGTWFQRFWEGGAGAPADVTPLKSWSRSSRLGTHAPPRTPTASLVLLIRSAIVRRYPEIRIYAAEAEWEAERRREKAGGDVHVPLFAARLASDIAVFGFDLEEDRARGSTVRPEHPGYFFVLEQPEGAPRFGLDVPRPRRAGTAPRNWANLSWSHLAAEGDPLATFVETGAPSWLVDAGGLPGNGPEPQTDRWGEDAAAMARITYQRPVRMLVHADSMLPPARRGAGRS